MGTSTYSMDVRLNSDGNPAAGIQFYIDTMPAEALTYGLAPITVLNNPFVLGDIQTSPLSGSIVNSGNQTAFYKENLPDYPALSDNAIATLQFNTASLAGGTYVFTPVGVEFIWSPAGSVTTFASPGTFSLGVVPEPGSFTLLGLGGAALMFLRKQRFRRRVFART